jgi:hypothetical protein
MTPAAPKIHVLLASEAPVGVVLYQRSLLTTYCLCLDYAQKGRDFRDHLTKGSRFRGRLFPQRCDLSPDGRLMIYFALQGKETEDRSKLETWTGICAPPWLKDHLVYPNGTLQGGGGRFLRNHRLFIDNPRPSDADDKYYRFQDYEIIHRPGLLTPTEKLLVQECDYPAAIVRMPRPVDGPGTQRLTLVRTLKPSHLDDYGRFDFWLESAVDGQIDVGKELVSESWAGWDRFGRLLAAAGRRLKIFTMNRPYPLRNPEKILDLEDAIK